MFAVTFSTLRPQTTPGSSPTLNQPRLFLSHFVPSFVPPTKPPRAPSSDMEPDTHPSTEVSATPSSCLLTRSVPPTLFAHSTGWPHNPPTPSPHPKIPPPHTEKLGGRPCIPTTAAAAVARLAQSVERETLRNLHHLKVVGSTPTSGSIPGPRLD